MPSTNKLKTYRRSDLSSKNPAKLGVRKLNQAIREQVEREREVVQLTARDAQIRASLMGSRRYPPDPLSVWADFEQYRDYTNLGEEYLNPWRSVGQYLKLHLLLRATLIFGGYSFTAKIRPDLESKWSANGCNPSERIFKLISNGLAEEGLSKLPLTYVIEGKGRRGYGSVGLHIHGFVQTEDPHVATSLKVMFSRKFACHPKGRAAAGYAAKAGKPVQFKPIYDAGDPANNTAGRWASYITKNVLGLDQRLRDKRIFVTKEGTALARELWSFMRGEG